jgi:hypothetical protein
MNFDESFQKQMNTSRQMNLQDQKKKHDEILRYKTR